MEILKLYKSIYFIWTKYVFLKKGLKIYVGNFKIVQKILFDSCYITFDRVSLGVWI